MRMKTFLLGSAAVLGFGGAAQAADLSVSYSEPVNYVRVCDAFGAGYFYIPGTDTCLRIGGYARVQVQWQDPDYYLTAGDYDHYQSWRFKARGHVDLDAASQTDWGPLIAHLEFEVDFAAGDGDQAWNEPSGLFVSLGPFTGGMYQSTFDVIGGGPGSNGFDGNFWTDGTALTDDKVLQMQLSWAFQGFGISLAVEDPSKYATNSWVDASNQGDLPSLVAAISGEWGNVALNVAFRYQDTNPDSTWGAQGNLEVSNLFGGAGTFFIGASYIDDGGGGSNGGFTGAGPLIPCSGNCTGQIWSALGGYKHAFTSNFTGWFDVAYDDLSDYGAKARWRYELGMDYYPVEDFLVRVEAQHIENDGCLTSCDDSNNVMLEFRRYFGG